MLFFCNKNVFLWSKPFYEFNKVNVICITCHITWEYFLACLCKKDFKNWIKSSKTEQFRKKKVHLQPYSSQWGGKGLIACYITCQAAAMVICTGPSPFRGADRASFCSHMTPVCRIKGLVDSCCDYVFMSLSEFIDLLQDWTDKLLK